MIGRVLGRNVSLVRTPEVAILVGHIEVYPDGMGFVLDIRAHHPDEWEDDPFEAGRPFPRRGRRGSRRDSLRFGVEFADGRKATNLDMWMPKPIDEQPDRPVLHPGGGGGGDGRWHWDYWLWPLPPAGPFAFVCEWPAKGIALTRSEIEAQDLVDAAAEAEVLWEEEPWSDLRFISYTSSAVAAIEEPDETEDPEPES